MKNVSFFIYKVKKRNALGFKIFFLYLKTDDVKNWLKLDSDCSEYIALKHSQG
jgi:hypothetical protein